MYSINFTSAYRRSLKLVRRRGLDMSKLDKTIALLASGEPLPPHYKDHPLKGNLKGGRECHVDGAFDWLLTYKKDKNRLILLLTGTGSHADLFE